MQHPILWHKIFSISSELHQQYHDILYLPYICFEIMTKLFIFSDTIINKKDTIITIVVHNKNNYHFF